MASPSIPEGAAPAEAPAKAPAEALASPLADPLASPRADPPAAAPSADPPLPPAETDPDPDPAIVITSATDTDGGQTKPESVEHQPHPPPVEPHPPPVEPQPMLVDPRPLPVETHAPPAQANPPPVESNAPPPAEHHHDDADDDADSAVGDGSDAESTASLTESIFAYRKLHGRTYQQSKTTEYWAPNDDQQNDGLDIIHNMMLMVLDDKLFHAPIGSNPQRVLDIGTGTGVWAIDFADQYPSSEVTGTDISPIQPTWVPPNLKFAIDDCILDWTWPTNHFDFIHIRAMYGCIPDWEELYRKAFRHLKPGGWLEDLEMDIRIQSDHVEIPKDHIYNQWAELFFEGGEKMGRTFAISHGHTMKDYMERVGFVDVVEEKVKIPLHGWPDHPRLQQAGYLGQLALDQSLEGFGTFLLTQVHGWQLNQAIVFIAKMRRETRKKANCPWYMSTIVYGRKPEDAN